MAALCSTFSQWFLRTLLPMSLSGGIVTLLLLVLKPLWSGRISKRWSYRLWKIALAGFLIPFSLFLSLPIRAPTAAIQRTVDRMAGESQWTGATFVPWAGPVQEPEDDAPQAAGVRLDSLMGVPCAVSAALLAVTLTGYGRFYEKLRGSRVKARAEEQTLLRELTPQKKDPPFLYRSPLAPTPMLVCVLDPAIYLPDREYTRVQLENILRHELTHLHRRDVLVKWLGVLLTCLHWFNPLAWLVRRELDRACELACDEEVIRDLDDGGKQAYGNTLIDMAAAGARLPGTVVSTAVCEEKRNLKDRLTAILNSGRLGRGAAALALTLAVLALCTAAVLGASPRTDVIDPGSVVSAVRMTTVLDKCPMEHWYDEVHLADGIPALREEGAVSDAYTAALVKLINSYRKTSYETSTVQAAKLYGSSNTWTRIDCADGGYYLLLYMETHGFSFNPLHPGEDDFESLLVRYDAGGNPAETWRMEYNFDRAYLDLQYDPYFRAYRNAQTDDTL